MHGHICRDSRPNTLLHLLPESMLINGAQIHVERRTRDADLISGSACIVKGPSKVSSRGLRTVRIACTYWEAIKLESPWCGDLRIGFDRPECDVCRARWDAPFHVSASLFGASFKHQAQQPQRHYFLRQFCVEHHLKARCPRGLISSSVQCLGRQSTTPRSCFRQHCIAEHRAGSILSERVQAHQCINMLLIAKDGSRYRTTKSSFVVQPGQGAHLPHLVSSCKALVLR